VKIGCETASAILLSFRDLIDMFLLYNVDALFGTVNLWFGKRFKRILELNFPGL
jgi:hypothetical protein